MSNSGVLAEDALRDILMRLDPKPLTRLKCVCKSWLSLLSDPLFTTSHHTLRNTLPHNHFTIVRAENHHISSFNTSTALPLTPLPTPLVGNLVGTCNGLVCLRSFGGKEIVLWNPLTRKCKRVINPIGSNKFVGGKISFSFGFGLDVDGFSFVCLRIVSRRWGDELLADVEIYSTLLDSWRALEGEFRFNLLDYTNCVIVKGVPYWTGIVKNVDKEEDDDGKEVFRKVVLGFDVRKGVFKELEYPQFTCQGGLRDCFVEFEGCLGVIMRRAIEAFNQCVDIWVLDEEESCWVKKFSVGPINVNIAGLVGFSIDKNVLGVDGDGNLFLYDSKTNEIKQVYSDVGNYWYIDIRGYTESLVSVPGMIGIETQEMAVSKMSTDLLRMEVNDFVVESNITKISSV
ncbi:hypothetical protein Leryth_026188 [Lithospermum erythrorhizon]|nr:hypothetical protein Leryth_026188 [Lithospermum erythrorhizon]